MTKAMRVDTVIGNTDKRGAAWIGAVNGENTRLQSFEGAIPDHVLYGLFDFEVVNVPLQATYTGADGELVTVSDPTRSVTLRTDTGHIFGTGKEGKAIHPYLDWSEGILGNVDGLTADRAGIIGYGAKAFLQYSVDENVVTDCGFTFRPTITFASSLDGSLPSTYVTGSVAIICDNFFTGSLLKKIADDASTVVKVRHTKHSHNKKNGIIPALGLVESAMADMSADIQTLSQTTVTDKEWSAFLDAYLPLPEAEGKGMTQAENARANLTGLYKGDPRCSDWTGTALGVVQAVSTYGHHVGIVRNADRHERNLERLVLGQHGDRDRTALDTLQRVLQTA